MIGVTLVRVAHAKMMILSGRGKFCVCVCVRQRERKEGRRREMCGCRLCVHMEVCENLYFGGGDHACNLNLSFSPTLS